ncbi:MATE family efflux transporter [Algibacter lectus]|uniref:MATE family efflux transporter n=1 Tax=Algibacter lectus TaxID=221126 RepID=UPI0011135439|nr:MATE family efflux transporter [Algibacter lectus]
MAISIVINLYTTRIILSALGVVDFGIFNLLAGVIALLSVLNISMSTATQRYISFHLGAGQINTLKSVYKTSVTIHLVLGSLIALILIGASFFIFDGFLNIPADRITTSKYVYYFMVVSTFFTINSVPNDAVINARENMLLDSIIGIIESILKLGIAIIISYSDYDKLILYSFLIALLIILIRVFKWFYCLRNYQECKISYRGKLDLNLLKEMNGYAGWNLFGAVCALGKSQGLAILLNIFLGTVVNAAYGIANQVTSQLVFFSTSMLRAINPQIAKSEGAGDRERMIRLSIIASKFGYFLLAFVAIPIMFELPTILDLWLKDVPQYTVTFCTLIISAIMVNQLTVGVDSAIHATGNIKLYMLTVGLIKLTILPFGYLLLKMGYSSSHVLFSYAIIEGIAGLSRLWILKKNLNINYNFYIKNVLVKVLIPTIILIGYLIVFTYNFKFNNRFLFTLPSGALFFLIATYFFGINSNEKNLLKNFLTQLTNRFTK